jgi:hypothetical protein
MKPYYYLQMFDQLWKLSKSEYIDFLDDLALNDSIEDMNAYGRRLALSTSRRYLNDWSKSIINVTDARAAWALDELKYLHDYGNYSRP